MCKIKGAFSRNKLKEKTPPSVEPAQSTAPKLPQDGVRVNHRCRYRRWDLVQGYHQAGTKISQMGGHKTLFEIANLGHLSFGT